MPPTTTRNALRAALLRGAPKSSTITIQADDGPLTVYVSEPTFKERNAIFEAAAKPGGKVGEVSIERLQLHALLRLVKDESGAPLFDLADAEVISALPASSEIVSVLIPAALGALRPPEGGEWGNAPTPPESSAA